MITIAREKIDKLEIKLVQKDGFYLVCEHDDAPCVSAYRRLGSDQDHAIHQFEAAVDRHLLGSIGATGGMA